MSVTTESALDLLQQMCADLRRLSIEAGGPSLRAVGARVGLGKSQVGAILHGRIRRPPDWTVVHGLVTSFVEYARAHDRTRRLSLPTGVDEYWRSRHALVEHAFANRSTRRTRVSSEVSASPGHPPGGPQPQQLPGAVRHFTGRDDELAALTRLIDECAESRRTVIITALSGTAGVGKTALAVHWAHRVRHRFPDGQLYVNLRGFGPSGCVMEPAEAVRRFLDALQVPTERIPAGFDAQIDLYRSLLADRRMLIVLDNARDTTQVRPLLPGAPGCLALVTSRNQLTGLVATDGAHPVTLDLLTPAEARELLARRLGTDRTTAEPDAVDQIITACARLPLALAVVAARAATQPHLPLTALADELSNNPNRLNALVGDDPNTHVRRVFSWSYQALTPDAALLFRLLGLHPGLDLTAAAAASLVGRSIGWVRPLLAELARANLVVEHVPGRYAFHDLLRAYAADRAQTLDSDPQRRTATRRILDHYLHTAYAADRLLFPARDPIALPAPQSGVTPEHLVNHQQALTWFAAEHTVLLAAVDHAAVTGFDDHTWRLSWTLATFLHRQGHWHDRVTTSRAAVAAAQRMGDPTATAHAYRNLANAYNRLRRFNDARLLLKQALDSFHQTGDLVGQARTHNDLAFVLVKQGAWTEALDHARHALALYQAAGHRLGQAIALNAVGWYQALLGDHRQALTACQEALTLHEQLDDRHGRAATLDSLGYVHAHLGHHAQAITFYRKAISLFRELGDRYFEAMTLVHLGDAHHATDRRNAAHEAWHRALTILTDLDHPDADQVRAKLDQPVATNRP
jgi:tetratricopeptide (TPR) repeat protein